MSDTPRTDNCLTEILDAFGYVHQGNCPQRWVNHARELERELNAANERIKRLEEALEECDWAFTKFCPEHESRYGDAWENVRDALNRPNPFKPYWQEDKP